MKTEKQKEIAEKYMLPERPFLYGMASAFDLFGVLGQGRNEQLLANLREDLRALEKDRTRSVWQDVGETLYWAMNEYERANGPSNRE
ncbi:MAG: hypothetical protein F4X02_07320 [Chloroflexi bacterium]|nr:hypothetical protein [Chloroflexota bacterium]